MPGVFAADDVDGAPPQQGQFAAGDIDFEIEPPEFEVERPVFEIEPPKGSRTAPPPGFAQAVSRDQPPSGYTDKVTPSRRGRFSAADIDFQPEGKGRVDFQPEGPLRPEVQGAVSSVPRPAPPVAMTPGNRYVAAPNQESPEVRLGKMVPEAAVPALTSFQRHVNEPLERMARSGAEVGAQIGQEAVDAATMLQHAPGYAGAYFTPKYGPTPRIQAPEERAAQEHPIASGVARGIGSVAGSTVADPRNWPFFASSAARPILQRIISGGFATQMTAGSIDAAKNLYQNWDKMSPAERAQAGTEAGISTIMAAGAVSHALSPTAPEARVPTRAEIAEHQVRTGYASPEAAKASYLAELGVQPTLVAPAPDVTGGTRDASVSGKTAGQWRAEAYHHRGTSTAVLKAIAAHYGIDKPHPEGTILPPVPPPPTELTGGVENPAPPPPSDLAPGAPGAQPIERRTNVAERKRIADMSPTEMRQELLTSPVTGLPNRRAFDESGTSPAVAMSDADGLKAFNDKFGYEAGNTLLRAKADALRQAGLEAFHDKGDEFLYRGTSTADLESKLENARQIFRNGTIEATLPDGTVKYLKGVDFSYGVGQEIGDAESALKAHKAEREERGERVRGGLPGVAEVSPGNEIPVPAGQTEVEPRVVPGARSAATGNETGATSIQDLTESIRRQVPERTPLTRRLQAGADLGQAATSARDAVTSALGRLKGGAAALWDAYARPPKWTDYEDATGKWSGADQANALDLERFTKALKGAVPDKLRREAISNWIEAGGDQDLLTQRTGKSAAPYKAGYETALNLTDAEKTIARNIMNRNDATLQEAQRAGLLQQGVENYVRHVYADNPKIQARVAAEMNFNSLQTKPSFTKQRVLPTYFDAEQLGFKPLDKDAGFLTASHERAFREALAARDYVKALMEGKAKDGRPLVATSWASAKELPAVEGQKSAAYLVKPNIRPGEEYADYRRIDHPALRGWRWAGKTEEGAPIFVQGDALVHPDVYQKLKNNLGRSALRSFEMEVGEHRFRPGAAVLSASSEIKHAILSFSAFHQTTLGIHAIEHRTRPGFLPKLDLSQPKQRFLVDRGLMVAQYDAMDAFGEGLASGGLVTKIPGIGPTYHAYIDYLFKDYLPRVKMAMALNALDRNTRIYSEKLSADQIGALTAKEANAAFGGLNYKLLGRNKTMQDVMRLVFMAPDFTEARARFIGQAARPYGREQFSALLLGALGFYTAGRIMNQIVDNDPHWDKPFSLVHNGKEYRLRTIQGDLWSAVTESGRFVRNRLSPLVQTSIQALEGRDRFGRKQSLGELAKDVAKSNVPIPLQAWTRKSDDPVAAKAFNTILKMVGVTESRSRSRSEERLRANAEKASTYNATYRRLTAEGDDEKTREFLNDRTNVAYLNAHSEFSEMLHDLRTIDNETKQVRMAKYLSDKDRQEALNGLKEARESLLSAADALDHQLTDVRLGMPK